MVRNAVWCLSNLCRGKSPAVDFNKVSESASSALVSFEIDMNADRSNRLLLPYPYSISFSIITMPMFSLIRVGQFPIYPTDRMRRSKPSFMLWTLDDSLNSWRTYLSQNASEWQYQSLSSYPVLNVQSSALRAVGNIVTGDDHQTQVDRSLVVSLNAARQTVCLGCTRCRCALPSANITAKSKRINQKGSMLDLI